MSQIADPIVAQSQWFVRFGRWSLRLIVLALMIGFGGLLLARYDAIPKIAGFGSFVGGALLCAVALLFALAAIIGTWRHGQSPGLPIMAGAVVALCYSGFTLTRPLASGLAPALHDITTDTAAPPQFEKLKLRDDNLAGVGTITNWKKMHSAAYADLRPIVVAGSVADVTARAEKVARDLGWAVQNVDPVHGRLEATDAVSFIRFYDDIVVRVTPESDGSSARVDIRSVSRIGIGDFGVNARRIRAFLKAMSAR